MTHCELHIDAISWVDIQTIRPEDLVIVAVFVNDFIQTPYALVSEPSHYSLQTPLKPTELSFGDFFLRGASEVPT